MTARSTHIWKISARKGSRRNPSPNGIGCRTSMIRDRSGFDPGSLQIKSSLDLASIKGRSRVDPGRFTRSGVDPGSSRGRSRRDLGSIRGDGAKIDWRWTFEDNSNEVQKLRFAASRKALHQRSASRHIRTHESSLSKERETYSNRSAIVQDPRCMDEAWWQRNCDWIVFGVDNAMKYLDAFQLQPLSIFCSRL